MIAFKNKLLICASLALAINGMVTTPAWARPVVKEACVCDTSIGDDGLGGKYCDIECFDENDKSIYKSGGLSHPLDESNGDLVLQCKLIAKGDAKTKLPDYDCVIN
jgi:hypothetical protein